MPFVLLGFAIGTLGTLIGAGGGFILVPILLALYPGSTHDRIAGISLAVVALNATSGSIAYFRKRQVHLRAGIAFILASLPGALLGVWMGKYISRVTFELIFGVALIAYSIALLLKKSAQAELEPIHHQSIFSKALYCRGIAISFFVAFVASFLGIGGGVIHVPLLSHVLDFPVHLATGTSHFILAITAWTATIGHLYYGDISLTDPIVLQLGIGAVVGAQAGAALSRRISGKVILRILGIALFGVGVRLVIHNL